jgi:transcriptional regulator with XRE-family HTH domain
MDVRVRIGLNVQRLRRGKDWSQEELAARAEVHQTYLSGVGRRRRGVFPQAARGVAGRQAPRARLHACAVDEIPLDFGAEESVRVGRRRQGMVEHATARAAMEALAAAIAELSESMQDAAVRPPPRAGHARLAVATRMRGIGEDVVVLAAAMEVLQRRAS